MLPASPALRFARLRRFRRQLSAARPDVVVAFQHGPFLFAAIGAAGTGVPLILSERNAPDRLDHLRAGRHRGVIFQSMRLATAITVQFPGYVGRYPAYLRSRIAVVPNPVARVDEYAAPGGDKPGRTLLCVGRLSYQKNIGSLVRAFADVSASHPRWRLRVVGNGDERAAIEELMDELDVRARVSLVEATPDVAAEYRNADLFCLPSRWEGFPNALAEAMAHGLPAVGFRGCAGVNELIAPGRNGQLAVGNGDPGSLAEVLGPLMEDDAERERLGSEARRIAEAYDPDRVFDEWEALLRRVARSR